MNTDEWNKMLDGCLKPMRCVCGKVYEKGMGHSGGFVTNGVTLIWCCSKNCANITQKKIM